MFRIFTEIKEKNPHFGSSLLLANIGPNSHMTPKIVNGSFAALFDTNDVVVDFSKKLQQIKDEARDSGIYIINLHFKSRRCIPLPYNCSGALPL